MAPVTLTQHPTWALGCDPGCSIVDPANDVEKAVEDSQALSLLCTDSGDQEEASGSWLGLC